MKKILVVFLFAAVMFPAGCSKVPYRSALHEWSAGGSVYCPEDFIAKLIWKATYLSPEFKSTARDKIDEWEKLSGNAPGVYPSYLSGGEEGVFLVSVYTPRGYPSINVEADNFWDLKLEFADGSAYAPSGIETVAITPREARLFPYINRWSRFYMIRFPVGSLGKPFNLALRSAAATSVLEWK